MILPTLKNLILYTNYNHDYSGLLKVAGQENSLFGTWEITFDDYDCGFDYQHHLNITLMSDSSGNQIYKSSGFRMNGEVARVYSWSSLLPLDDSKSTEFFSNIIIENGYLVFIPDSGYSFLDTSYAKFKLSNDTLFIDELRYRNYYKNNPIFKNSKNAQFSEILKFWRAWL